MFAPGLAAEKLPLPIWVASNEDNEKFIRKTHINQ